MISSPSLLLLALSALFFFYASAIHREKHTFQRLSRNEITALLLQVTTMTDRQGLIFEGLSVELP